jgi:hypothetical protein
MTNQLKLMVGASGAILGLIVGIGIGLIVNSGGGGGEPSRPVSTSLVVATTSIPRATTTDAPIAAAP